MDTNNAPETAPSFHLPVREYGPIDALNRRAAAVGSPAYCQATAHADYNGHALSVHWNDYRGYYIAEYWYAGRNVLARGGFRECLAAAKREYDRGALGCSVSISPRADDFEAVAICREQGIPEGDLPQSPEWYTWRHSAAAQSVRDYANPRAIRRRFDYELLMACQTEAEYDAAMTERYGSPYEF